MPYKDKSKNQWIAQVMDGKKKHCHRCATKKEAQQWEGEKKAELERAASLKGQTRSASLLEWATAYLEYSQQQHVKLTFEEKRFAFKQLFRSVDHGMPVDELTSMQALNHLREEEKTRSGNGANKDRKNLRAAWEWGTRFMGLPEKNPFAAVNRFAEVRDDRVVPTLGDFWAVYQAADTDQDHHMLFFLLQTGARRDEVFRLRWRDVDFPGKRVRIMWRKNAVGEWKESWLPIGDDLVGMLERQRRVTGLLGHVFMWQADDGSGKWMPYLYRQHWLKRLCAKAGVKQFGFHGIRHLFASILASKNVPLVEIQKMLRHGSIQTTARYIHSLQDGSREALAALPGLHQEQANERKVM